MKITSGGTAGLLSGNMLPDSIFIRKRDLGYHKLSSIKFASIRLDYPRQVGKNSMLDIHGNGVTSGIHILYTDKGAYGWGLNRASEKLTAERFDRIKGKTVEELIVPETGIPDPELAIFDFALFDLSGIILKKPVYQLLGKRNPETFPCYSGMIYFDDLEPADKPAGVEKILEECQWDFNYGYRQFKLKIGRGYRWMEKEKGLQRDVEVTNLVAKNFPGCDILVDGNNGFTVDELIKYLEGIRETILFWIEEPFHETVDDYVKLNSWLKSRNLSPLLADGEANPDEKVLKALGSQNIINVFLQDISGYGFTRWIKLIQDIRSMGIMASPHAWGSAIKTNYISHLAGAFGATATIEGVTCTSEDVDLTGYVLKKGKLIPSSKPGFGMDLLKKV